MGIIIIPLVTFIILAILLKKGLICEYEGSMIVGLIISAVLTASILFVATCRYYENRSMIAQYHFNPCGSKAWYLADKMAQHREFHDDWFIGVFYSDSLANLPYPQCEQ